MSLLDGDSLSELFAFPTEQLQALPDLLTADLERGQDFVTRLASGEPPARRPTIHIPAWDEILHVVPESFLPIEEQDDRRRARAIQISQSPTPESARAIGSLLTWVDDIQDGLVTAAVLTRLISTFYKPALPVAALLQEAAAATNLFQLGAQVPAITLTGKFRGQSVVRSLVGTQSAKAASSLRINRVAPSIGEIIQIAQTTDTLFGVGLSLGPIVGLFQDVIFGVPSGAEFAFQSGIRYRPGDELFLRQEDQDRAEQLRLHGPLGKIISAAAPAAWILASPPGPSFSDRVDALVLLSLVAELTRGFLVESRWEPLVLPVLGIDRPSTAQVSPRTALEIHRLGLDPHATEAFPTQGNPHRLSPRAQADLLAAQGTAALPAWLAEAPSKEAGLFARQLAADLGFRMIRAFEGCPCAFETHNTPPWRAVIDSFELGLKPPAGATPAAAQAYIEEATALYHQDEDRRIPIHDLRRLFAKHYPGGSS